LAPVTLDQADLPEYALPSTLHIFAANRSSLVFTLLVATLAANSRRAGLPIVPAATPPEWNPKITRQPMQTAAKPPMTLPCGALSSPPGKCYAGSLFVQYLRE
jgi:hypothetical protein